MNKKKPRRKCLCCLTECKRPHQVYCSNKCQQYMRTRKIRSNWNENKNIGVFSARNIMMEELSGSCQLCGWNKKNPVTNSAPLEVHHIDGDWRNNRKSNLQLLCPNCHSLTESYKALNKRFADRNVCGQRKKW